MNVYRLLEDLAALDSITANILATPTGGTITISVNDTTQWPIGSRMEVDDEIFYVTANTGTNPITVQRAYESTAAAAHTSGTIARRDPRFLRKTVTEAINVCIGNWCSFFFPKLSWDITTGGTFTPINWIITAPADALAVRRVTWQIPGFKRFQDVAHSDLQEFPTGIASTGYGFELYEMGLPGRPINVLYEKRWPELVLESDTLDTDFPPEANDLVHKGAALYVAGWRQVPKWRFDEVEFHRETGQAQPTQLNASWVSELHNEFYRRAREIAARRPVASSPGMVYRGFTL